MATRTRLVSCQVVCRVPNISVYISVLQDIFCSFTKIRSSKEYETIKRHPVVVQYGVIIAAAPNAAPNAWLNLESLLQSNRFGHYITNSLLP